MRVESGASSGTRYPDVNKNRPAPGRGADGPTGPQLVPGACSRPIMTTTAIRVALRQFGLQHYPTSLRSAAHPGQNRHAGRLARWRQGAVRQPEARQILQNYSFAARTRYYGLIVMSPSSRALSACLLPSLKVFQCNDDNAAHVDCDTTTSVKRATTSTTTTTTTRRLGT